MSAGTAWLPVKPDMRGFGSEVDRSVQSAGTKAGGSFSSSFKSKLKLGAGIVAALGGAAAFNFMKGAVKQASDLGESINAVNVTFGKSAKGIHELGKTAAQSLGLSRSQFNGLSVQFSAFAKTIAGKGGNVVGTMKTITTRAADFASVMNIDVAEAAEKFQSGLAGETEPLKKFGIDLSAAAIDASDFAKEIGKGNASMTESEKVQARYSLLMKQTSKTAGDFANTSDSLANSQRILGAKWDDLQAKVGTKLLPVLAKLTTWVADDFLPAAERWWGVLEQKLGPVFSKVGGFIKDKLVPGIKDLIDRFTGAKDGTDKVGKAMKDAEPFLNVVKAAFKGLGVIIREVIVPILQKVAEHYLPVMAKAWGFVGKAVTFLWNNVLAPIFRLVLRGFAALMDNWSRMLKVLGKVPGFEWAKDASRKLANAADEARGLANGIKDIPSSKKVSIEVRYKTVGLIPGPGAVAGAVGSLNLDGKRALGGPVRAGGRYLVGERGPEILEMPRFGGGRVIPNHRLGPSGQMLSGAQFGGAGSGGIAEGAIQITMPATATPQQSADAAGGRVLSALTALGV